MRGENVKRRGWSTERNTAEKSAEMRTEKGPQNKQPGDQPEHF